MTFDRIPPLDGDEPIRGRLPEDDGYDHDLDDPEFYHYGEEIDELEFDDDLEDPLFDVHEWNRD